MRLTLESIGQLKLRRNLLIIGSLSLVSILIWMSYSLYDIYSRNAQLPEVQKYLTPLNPSLDIDTLKGLEDRYNPPQDFAIIAIQPNETGQAAGTFTITRDGQSQAVPVASPAADLTPPETVVPPADAFSPTP